MVINHFTSTGMTLQVSGARAQNPRGMEQLIMLITLGEIMDAPAEQKWATKKTRTYFPWNTGWLIGILISWFIIIPK